VYSRTVIIRHKSGLHVRPAGLFVEAANRFRSAVRVNKGEKQADGRSILSLMLLEVTPGTELTISAEGEDETAAADTLAALLEGGFDEDPGA
jgi:phosphocarrier protein